MAKQLVVITGLERGRTIPLADPDILQFGCSQNLPVEHRFRDPSVARVHCEVQVDDDRVVLSDGGTTGGTFLNGKRITREELRPGDVVRIGNTQLRFLCDTPAEAPAAPSGPADVLGLLVGRSFAQFRVELLVGTGHWGRVFRARDTRSGRTVALKVLGRAFAESPGMLEHFAEALKAVLPIRHPNLVSLFGAGRAGPYGWIAAEFVEAQSLTHVIRRIGTTGRLEWRQALRVALEVGRALRAAHARGVVHGHITPQNILVGDQDQVAKLTDLLLAKTLAGTTAVRLTPPADDVPYLAPERTLGTGGVDERSDVYGLGAVVYALLTGRPPFQAEPGEETLEETYQSGPVKPSKYQPGLPARFETAVLRMLRKRPEDRFPSAADLVSHLEQVEHESRTTA